MPRTVSTEQVAAAFVYGEAAINQHRTLNYIEGGTTPEHGERAYNRLISYSTTVAVSECGRRNYLIQDNPQSPTTARHIRYLLAQIRGGNDIWRVNDPLAVAANPRLGWLQLRTVQQAAIRRANSVRTRIVNRLRYQVEAVAARDSVVSFSRAFGLDPITGVPLAEFAQPPSPHPPTAPTPRGIGFSAPLLNIDWEAPPSERTPLPQPASSATRHAIVRPPPKPREQPPYATLKCAHKPHPTL